LEDDPLLDELLGITPDERRIARGKNRAIPIESPPPKRRTVNKRLTFNQLRLEKSADALSILPVPNESHHHIIDGTFDSYMLIPSLMDKVGGVVAELRLATLGFNAKHTEHLISQLTDRTIQRCTLLVSEFYVAEEDAVVCNRLKAELPKFGTPPGWFHATRCHAKIIMLRFQSGQSFVIESSANLRTCRSIEQFVICCDDALYDFHASWMDEIYEAQRE
jgi:hypothetical protein